MTMNHIFERDLTHSRAEWASNGSVLPHRIKPADKPRCEQTLDYKTSTEKWQDILQSKINLWHQCKLCDAEIRLTGHNCWGLGRCYWGQQSAQICRQMHQTKGRKKSRRWWSWIHGTSEGVEGQGNFKSFISRYMKRQESAMQDYLCFALQAMKSCYHLLSNHSHCAEHAWLLVDSELWSLNPQSQIYAWLTQ